MTKEKKEAYVVLVGLKPGVYKQWLEASPHVTGVSKAQYQGFTDADKAAEFYKRAHKNGETRTVTKSPSLDEKSQDEGERHQAHRGEQERQPPRNEQDSCLAASVQMPTSTSKGSSAGRALRDAQIAAAFEEARKNMIGPSASSPSVIPSERRQPNEPSRHPTLTRSATEPAYHLQPQVQHSSTVPVFESESARTPPRSSSIRRMIELPTLEPELEPRPRTQETKIASESSGPGSDIPTHQTQTKNHFTNSPGLSTPRYAQSLSYASSPSSLASSDLRSHLSSPSSCDTRYFPDDWLVRHGRRRESNDSEWRGDDQSSIFSEYATAPDTPEQGSIELEDEVEDMRGVPSPSTSKHSRAEWFEPSSASPPVNSKARPKTRSSATLSPATASKVISYPNATSTPRRTGSTPNSMIDPFSLSVVPKRQHLGDRDQTSSIASSLPASTTGNDIPVRPLPGGYQCACEHPEYACICVNCGQRPRIEPSSARSAADKPRSTKATRAPSSKITTTASPALSELLSASSSPTPSGTPGSAVRSSVHTRSSSSRSHVGGHTPVLGPSETRAYTRSQTTRIQESLGMMSFSEAARGVGAEAVVHDVSFDPRSPIQRGTNIPAGTSGSAVRPSPAMAAVPMGSLGLLFPPAS